MARLGDRRYSIKAGYIRVFIEGRGYLLEHRYVVEQKIGRKLRRGEHIHHIDGNKSNNHPDNLQIMSHSEHAKHHGMVKHGRRRIEDRPSPKRRRKPKEKKVNQEIVPKDKLPRGCFYHRDMGIAEKRRKTK